MNNNEIFQEFWNNFQWSEPQPVLFRLYYDAQGRPLEYSQEDHEGQYLDITPEQWVLADFRVRVIDGQIVPQDPPLPPKLKPADTGTRCHPLDVCIVIDQEPYQAWSMSHDQN